MLIHKETNSLLLRSRDPQRIISVLPHSRVVDYEGHNLQVRFGYQEVKVLRNMGLNVPSPMRTAYSWPGRWTPFDHQYTTSEFLAFTHRGFVLNEMGTGKTASVIWAADYLMNVGETGKVLIAAPLSTLRLTWEREIFGTTMHRTSAIVHGSREKRAKALAADVDFYIINHQGIGIMKDEIRARSDIKLVVLDEGSMYRNAQTKAFRDLVAMLRPDMRLWVLTGSPCPKAPTDAWALAKLVDPSRVPKYFTAFQRETMLQVSTHKWVPRAGAYERVYEVLQPAIRFKKSDCVDIPPTTMIDMEVGLTTAQKRAFEDMRKHMVATFKEAEKSGTPVSAVNAADQINKLRQILCGAVKIAEGEYVDLDCGPRIDVLEEVILSTDAKVIVVCPFKGILRFMHEELERRGIGNAVINGDVSIAKRNAIFERFKDDPDLKTILCHPKVMSHGLNLIEADTLVFYAPIYSTDQYVQVKERMARPGQTKHMTIARLVAHPLEAAIYAALDRQEDMQNLVLSMYADLTKVG